MVKQLIKLGFIALTVSLINSCSPTTNTANDVTEVKSQTAANLEKANPQELKNVKVLLSWLLQGVDAPLMTAIEKGYFKQEGLNVTWERGFGNVDTISKLGVGQYDLGFSDLYNMIEFNDKNPSQKLVAVAVPFNKGPFAIITLKKSGIDSPKELVGKKLGSPAGDGPRRLWPLFAKQIGIDPKSVTWTTMDPKLRETFLVQGQVDAISGFSISSIPNIIKTGRKPEDINIFYYNDNGLDFYGNAILGREEFIKANPEVVKSFVRAYIRGLQDTITAPEAAFASVKKAGDTLLDVESEKLRLEIGLERLIITDEAKKNGLGTVEPERLQKTIDQTAAGFKLKKKPTSKEVFVDSFLPSKQERNF